MHSPAHLLRLFSSPDLYGIGLLIEIALGGIGMVLLSRFYGLSIAASILSALAFVLCPRILVQVDISGNECLFPFVFLGFAWLSARPSILRAALVGVLCAIIAYSSHPETCFFAVLFAAILSLCSMILPESAGAPPAPTPSPSSFPLNPIALVKNTAKAIGYLLITAFVSVSIAAPLVFPFLEFMRNAYIYKDASGFTTPLSIQQFIEGFYINQGQEPFFMGAVAALLVPLGFFNKPRTACAFFLTFLFGFAICFPQGAMINLLAQKPISYVATMYGVPDLILMMAVLAGMGLDLVLQNPSKIKSAVLLVSVSALTYLPIEHLKQITGSQDFHILWRSGNTLLTAITVLAEIAFIICAVAGKWLPARFRMICAAALVALNFASLALIDRNVLPVNEKFSLQSPPGPIKFLQQHHGRCIATGSNLFLPNANLDFGIEDFRNFSPLLPLRYKKFLDETGARCYNLYFYVMPDRCSRLLDLASVKYVLTRAAIRADDEDWYSKGGINLGECKVKRFVPGFRVLQAALRFNPENSQVDAEMTLRVHQICNYRYALQYCVLDANKNEVWSSRELMISPAEEAQHTSEVHESWPIPLGTKFPVSVGLRVKDTWISQFVEPEENVAHSGNAFLLCTVENDGHEQPKDEHHYRLVQEFKAEGCRIYENQHNCPPAFMVGDAVQCKHDDSESVWREIKEHHNVAIEDDELDSLSTNSWGDAVPISRPDCNTVLVDCDAKANCWLVLTDSYYPGWKCFVDGKETKISPANYLFRAVKLSQGRHKVKFCFAPSSYLNGLALAGTVLLCVGLFTWWRRKELFVKDEAV
jgi:hypothetical protein